MKEFRAADAGERQEKMGMEKICVYADFDFLKEKEQIGTLFGEQVRGSRHFSFEFATGWLEDHGSVILGETCRMRPAGSIRLKESSFSLL